MAPPGTVCFDCFSLAAKEILSGIWVAAAGGPLLLGRACNLTLDLRPESQVSIQVLAIICESSPKALLHALDNWCFLCSDSGSTHGQRVPRV